ncbi:transmembrane protein 61 [Pogona vitticeps]
MSISVGRGRGGRCCAAVPKFLLSPRQPAAEQGKSSLLDAGGRCRRCQGSRSGVLAERELGLAARKRRCCLGPAVRVGGSSAFSFLCSAESFAPRGPLHGDLHYSTVEPLEKQTSRTWEASAIPTYEEAVNCQPAENVPNCTQAPMLKESRLPVYQVMDENETWHGGRRRSSSDSVLFRNIPPRLDSESWNEGTIVCDTPPPSYESIGSCDG